MTIPMLPRLSSIASGLQLVLCDLWGVVHDGRRAFPEAVACLGHLMRAGVSVYLVSNAPRPSSSVIQQLNALGVHDGCYNDVVTSGDITRAAISGALDIDVQSEARHDFLPLSAATCLHLGPERDVGLFEGLGCKRLSWTEGPTFDAVDFILCTGLLDDETETVDDYRYLLTEAVSKDLLLICANPDLLVMRGASEVPCAGALAATYADLGGRVRYFGKPHSEIYQFCLDKWRGDSIENNPRGQISTDQILAVGDSLRTDIAGARRMGFRSVLVAGGIHSAELEVAPGQFPNPNRVETVCAVAGITPDAVMARLEW